MSDIFYPEISEEKFFEAFF